MTVTLWCATCVDDSCPDPPPDSFTFTYYEQLLWDSAITNNRQTQCDTFKFNDCGKGTCGDVSVKGEQRLFCLDAFPDQENPFNGAPSGSIPIPTTQLNCVCWQVWSSGNFPFRQYSSDPVWWDDHLGEGERSMDINWDCCQIESQTQGTCKP
ncbi:MAG: hypothetical protein ACR2GY_10895 [Phycisphaerales bacterium]